MVVQLLPPDPPVGWRGAGCFNPEPHNGLELWKCPTTPPTQSRSTRVQTPWYGVSTGLLRRGFTDSVWFPLQRLLGCYRTEPRLLEGSSCARQASWVVLMLADHLACSKALASVAPGLRATFQNTGWYAPGTRRRKGFFLRVGLVNPSLRVLGWQRFA